VSLAKHTANVDPIPQFFQEQVFGNLSHCFNDLTRQIRSNCLPWRHMMTDPVTLRARVCSTSHSLSWLRVQVLAHFAEEGKSAPSWWKKKSAKSYSGQGISQLISMLG
jgi:hypothetical protein